MLLRPPGEGAASVLREVRELAGGKLHVYQFGGLSW